MRQVLCLFAVVAFISTCKTTKAPVAEGEVISEANPAGESTARIADDEVPVLSPSPKP